MPASTPKGRSTPIGTDDVQPLALCKRDRRKFYGLLDAEVPARLRRLEFGFIALIVATASPKVGGPTVGQVGTAVVTLILG